MNIIKKQGIGTWISLGTCVIALIAAILYGASSATTFFNATIPSITACATLSVILLAVVVVVGQFKNDGLLGKVLNIVIGVLRIVIPVLFTLCLLYTVDARVNGLGQLYFSDSTVTENFTAEQFRAGSLVIADLVMYGIAMLASCVAAFFSLRKKNAD